MIALGNKESTNAKNVNISPLLDDMRTELRHAVNIEPFAKAGDSKERTKYINTVVDKHRRKHPELFKVVPKVKEGEE